MRPLGITVVNSNLAWFSGDGVCPKSKDKNPLMNIFLLHPSRHFQSLHNHHKCMDLATWWSSISRLFIPSLVRSEKPLRHSIYSSTNQCKWINYHTPSAPKRTMRMRQHKLWFNARLPALVLLKMIWIYTITDHYIYIHTLGKIFFTYFVLYG
jgi:hypothetical protein